MSRCKCRLHVMTASVLIGIVSVLLVPATASAAVSSSAADEPGSPALRDDLERRLDAALDRWRRWLAGYLYQVPGTDLYTMNPTLGTGANPYRDVAGNTFAAAAAQYWLGRHPEASEEIARPLRGLVKLMLGTHIAVKTVDRPDIQKWGASLSMADDWHADLFAVAMSMLMLDTLPADQREQLLTILKWEADKQVEYGISKKWRTWPGRSPDHSCGESNAWSATLLAMARVAVPASQRDAAWRESAIDYCLNAICMPQDMASDEVAAGRPLKERVKGANFEPGGIQEHHGFYHPGYEGWPLAYLAYAYLLDQQLPASGRSGEVYLHNWKTVYDRLKQATFADGRFIYCAGFDWISYGYGNTQFFPAAIFAAMHFGDRDGSRMADEWLKLVELQQAATGGSVQGVRLATMQRLRINDFSWYEGQEGCVLAQALWVLRQMKDVGLPLPASEDEFHTRNVATYYEPNARLVWHRDAHRFASFSWRSAFGECQAIVQPVRLPHLLKFNHNSLGLLDVSGLSPSLAIEWFAIDTFKEGGFWSMGSLGRLSKKVIHGWPNNVVSPMVREHQAMVVLPEGPTLFVDVCEALDQLWLLREGSLGLRLAADIFTDNGVNLTVDGRTMRFGQHPYADTWHDLASDAVTIEKLLTIHSLTPEAGSFHLLQKRQRPSARNEMLYTNDPFGPEESLLTHELYFGPPAYDRPRIVEPGEIFRKHAFVIYCNPADVPAQPMGQISGDFPCVRVDLPQIQRQVFINFGDAAVQARTAAGAIKIEPHTVVVAPLVVGAVQP